MSNKISLDLGDPPADIFMDLVNLPDPVKLGSTIRYYNYDDVTLYFRITAEGAGWTFGTVNLGSLSSGTSDYRHLDEFGARAKPAAELSQTLVFTLQAFTDAGYTNLKWTFTRTLSINFIDSSDPSYTQDILNNFDDGTVQGWAATTEIDVIASCAVAEDYVLSPPYSLKTVAYRSGVGEGRFRIVKTITTPNKSVIYGIIDVRVDAYANQTKYLQVQRDSTNLIFLGKPYSATVGADIPSDKWLRIVVPLPPSLTFELRIRLCRYNSSTGTTYSYMWLDDFKVISK